MWPDRVSNPGPLTCGSGSLPTALRGPAKNLLKAMRCFLKKYCQFNAFLLHCIKCLYSVVVIAGQGNSIAQHESKSNIQ